MAETKHFDVFISYSHRDETWASEFVHALEAEGVSAWYDRSNIAVGDRWDKQTEQALRESRIVVAVVSPDYVSNPSTFFELGAAVGDNKKIIPILTQNLEQARIPAFFGRRQWLKESSAKVAGKRVAEVIGQLSHDDVMSTEEIDPIPSTHV